MKINKSVIVVQIFALIVLCATASYQTIINQRLLNTNNELIAALEKCQNTVNMAEEIVGDGNEYIIDAGEWVFTDADDSAAADYVIIADCCPRE